jgi:hypothetical protein
VPIAKASDRPFKVGEAVAVCGGTVASAAFMMVVVIAGSSWGLGIAAPRVLVVGYGLDDSRRHRSP